MVHFFGHHAPRLCVRREDVRGSLIFIKYRLQHRSIFFSSQREQKFCICSILFNVYMLTKLTLRYLLSMVMVYYDFHRALPGKISMYRWKRNKVWIYQSLSKLKYKQFFFSKGERKGKGVRPGKARRCSATEVDRSRAIFWANPYNGGLFSRDSE